MSTKKLHKQLIGASAMVMEMSILILLFGFAGSWLDRSFSSSPLLLFVGVVIGLILGMYRLITTLNRLDRPPPNP